MAFSFKKICCFDDIQGEVLQQLIFQVIILITLTTSNSTSKLPEVKARVQEVQEEKPLK